MNFHRKPCLALSGRRLDMASPNVLHHSLFRAERQNSLQRATAFGHFRNMSKTPHPGPDETHHWRRPAF